MPAKDDSLGKALEDLVNILATVISTRDSDGAGKYFAIHLYRPSLLPK